MKVAAARFRTGFRDNSRFMIALLGLIVLTLSGRAHAGYATLVVDYQSGRILNSVNPDQLNHPASLTKMMTLYLAFEALQEGRLTLDQRLPVSVWAANKSPTKLGLLPGQTITVRDCILGMITKSANDAATVMAEHLGGSESHFADMMTAKAHALGMDHTTYHNASGLPDPNQYTTARDYVRLSIALYRNFPIQFQYFATREFRFRGQLVRGHNHLMERYAGMDGIKTGFTEASGFNLASTASRNGRRLFGVVLGGRSHEARDNLMATLLDDGFANRPTDPRLIVAAAGVHARGSDMVLANEDEGVELPANRPAVHHHGHRQHGAIILAAMPQQRWAIQLGSYGKRTEAEHASHKAARLAGLSSKPAAIVATKHHRHKPGSFLARFSGLSRPEAAKACRVLHSRGQGCVVLSPGKKGHIRLASE